MTKARYLDIYEDIYAEMVYASKFDENSDLSTTYLGKTDMTRNTKIKAEERFPITGQGFASGKLLDTGATKSYMSKPYYLRCKLYMHYQSSLQIHREFKWETDNMSVYYL